MKVQKRVSIMVTLTLVFLFCWLTSALPEENSQSCSLRSSYEEIDAATERSVAELLQSSARITQDISISDTKNSVEQSSAGIYRLAFLRRKLDELRELRLRKAVGQPSPNEAVKSFIAITQDRGIAEKLPEVKAIPSGEKKEVWDDISLDRITCVASAFRLLRSLPMSCASELRQSGVSDLDALERRIVSSALANADTLDGQTAEILKVKRRLRDVGTYRYMAPDLTAERRLRFARAQWAEWWANILSRSKNSGGSSVEEVQKWLEISVRAYDSSGRFGLSHLMLDLAKRGQLCRPPNSWVEFRDRQAVSGWFLILPNDNTQDGILKIQAVDSDQIRILERRNVGLVISADDILRSWPKELERAKASPDALLDFLSRALPCYPAAAIGAALDQLSVTGKNSRSRVLPIAMSLSDRGNTMAANVLLYAASQIPSIEGADSSGDVGFLVEAGLQVPSCREWAFSLAAEKGLFLKVNRSLFEKAMAVLSEERDSRQIIAIWECAISAGFVDEDGISLFALNERQRRVTDQMVFAIEGSIKSSQERVATSEVCTNCNGAGKVKRSRSDVERDLEAQTARAMNLKSGSYVMPVPLVTECAACNGTGRLTKRNSANEERLAALRSSLAKQTAAMRALVVQLRRFDSTPVALADEADEADSRPPAKTGDSGGQPAPRTTARSVRRLPANERKAVVPSSAVPKAANADNPIPKKDKQSSVRLVSVFLLHKKDGTVIRANTLEEDRTDYSGQDEEGKSFSCKKEDVDREEALKPGSGKAREFVVLKDGRTIVSAGSLSPFSNPQPKDPYTIVDVNGKRLHVTFGEVEKVINVPAEKE